MTKFEIVSEKEQQKGVMSDPIRVRTRAITEVTASEAPLRLANNAAAIADPAGMCNGP
jgi:hypothetical protein